jgi:ribonucleoside-diphosphate reductase alpha chain
LRPNADCFNQFKAGPAGLGDSGRLTITEDHMNANESLFAASMPTQDVSADVLQEKYAKGDETTVAQVRARVARALAAHEPEPLRLEMEQRFLWAQDHGFVPAGRINSAAGIGL